MLGFQGGVSIPLVKGGVKAPPAKRQCRAAPKAWRGFTSMVVQRMAQPRRRAFLAGRFQISLKRSYLTSSPCLGLGTESVLTG